MLHFLAVRTVAEPRRQSLQPLSTEPTMFPVPFEPSSPRSGERVGTNLDTSELLDRLPLSHEGDSERHETYIRARELALESREADLAEWEQALAAMESDLRNRDAILKRRIEDEDRRRVRDPGTVAGTLSERDAARDFEQSVQLDRKVELMNDLLNELKASQTENLAARRALDERSLAVDRRNNELDQLEDSLSDATSEVVSAKVTVSAQQNELEVQRAEVRSELNQLQVDREAFDSDRQQVQELLEALREERAALQRERERYLLECGPLPVTPGESRNSEAHAASAEETAASADAQAESLSETISTELGQDSDRFNRLFAAPREMPPSPAPPKPAAPVAAEYELHDCDENSIAEYMDRLLNRSRRGASHVETPVQARPARSTPAAPQKAPPVSTSVAPPIEFKDESSIIESAAEAPPARVRPRQNTQEIREGIHQLRQVANQSAHAALSRHFWKRHRPTFTLKLALVVLSFSLAALLSMNHGVTTTSYSAVTWCAAAIGLITACNLAHTLTELSRLNARFQQEAFARLKDETSTTTS